jgi:hypothetical protein
VSLLCFRRLSRVTVRHAGFTEVGSLGDGGVFAIGRSMESPSGFLEKENINQSEEAGEAHIGTIPVRVKKTARCIFRFQVQHVCEFTVGINEGVGLHALRIRVL